MSTKHTPGVWRASHITGNGIMGDLDHWDVRADSLLVCQLWQRSIKEQPHNARLIAAAPDLLSIAMRLNALEGEWHPDRYQDEKDLLLKDARSAIKKATGEEA